MFQRIPSLQVQVHLRRQTEEEQQATFDPEFEQRERDYSGHVSGKHPGP